MNYYEARQRKDGRWDFTCMNGGSIWPVGYCRNWSDWREDMKRTAAAEYQAYCENKDRYHGEGHATKEEAERCFHTYELDTKLKLDECPSTEQHLCAVYLEDEKQCQTWTQMGLSLGGETTWLCLPHRTRAVFEKLHPFEPGRQIISSW